MATLDELLTYIFDKQQPPFYQEFEAWVRGSRRFKAFAIQYRSKIRTKIRGARDDHYLNDLRAELETALCLLRDDSLTLEYEKYTASKQRGPDFTVTFKTHTPFNIEVRRLRGAELEEQAAESGQRVKLIGVLCDKVGQMPPGIINFLWLRLDRPLAEADLTEAVNTLRLRAERKEEAFFTGRGFASAADFLKAYRQLSGIILYPAGGLWLNPLAKHQAPPPLINVIRRINSG